MSKFFKLKTPAELAEKARDLGLAIEITSARVVPLVAFFAPMRRTVKVGILGGIPVRR